MPAGIPTIDTLKAEVGAGRGFSNPSLYYVSLPPLNASPLQRRSIELMAKSITLPSRSMLTTERMTGTDLTTIPYGYQNQNITMTFRVLNDQLTRQYFESWQQGIIRDYSEYNENHYQISYADDVMKDIRIFQLERSSVENIQGVKIDRSSGVQLSPEAQASLRTSARVNYTWWIQYAYPLSFQQETLSDDAVNVVSEITVEFAYKKWKGYQLQPNINRGIDTSVGVAGSLSRERVGGTKGKPGPKRGGLI